MLYVKYSDRSVGVPLWAQREYIVISSCVKIQSTFRHFLRKRAARKILLWWIRRSSFLSSYVVV
jgi:hypothetical protein